MVMEVMVAKKVSLSELYKEVKIFPQLLKNVQVADKKEALEDPDVIDAIGKATKELGDEGRILVRESGTEPVVRVMVEAKTKELCQTYVDSVAKLLH